MSKISRAAIAATASLLLLSGCAAQNAAGSEGESKYLDNVKSVWIGNAPSDADLIEYGQAACDALADGEKIREVVAVPGASGEDVLDSSSGDDLNNWHVVRFSGALCP